MSRTDIQICAANDRAARTPVKTIIAGHLSGTANPARLREVLP